MSEKIVISPTTRQEGHAELVMEVDDEGIVTKGRYFSITPVRGLEKMVVGKAPETPPVLCQRICGVCPIPHTLASVEAIDDSLDIEVPKAGKIMREVTLAAHCLDSAAIHHFLIAPDFVPDNLFKTAVDSVSNIRKKAQFIVDTLAGEGIHPSDIRVGGMARNISPLAKEKITKIAKELVPDVEKHAELIEGLVADKGLPKDLGVVKNKPFSSSPYYGDRSYFDFDKFSEIMPEQWYDDPEIGKRACSTIPLWEGKPIETGPRARMEMYHGFKDKGVVAQHVARAEEMKLNAARIVELVDQLDTSAPVRADFDPRGTNKLGLGVIEAPRGTDVHMAQIKDGRVQYYSCLVPTTWNIPIMGPATEGFHHEYGPHVIRAYDPCLSCATHVMVVDDDDKSVLKSEMVNL
ncbi:MAG: coenzyme F420 hydrogenase subunit alpha [Methanobrevibacter boviskoreani]|uniref:coenzyme F420 hydrogenase subunit alpha n=1 Tax=Methanobrevibacter TaxID=2172 RepID=UPI0003348C07|nr:MULTISPECIES: coenzyme F420 hydrogenase subunit alpha [Methanobrevibacter]AGN17496.1 coenzyme F420 hydrogenase alpha subunit FrhA [Methanobrevibacter sp. AbM4]MCI6775539.1 coenzyme F420 hydrogenase subunit alpha [Methanobrevibacter boviskoreani]MCI6930384.1 coenzyme F420 hydrogenase subunit alpha [Methanobrevibacter boviskoreani]MDD6256889.1 coenzyme F420 hydrogenase subunit alpha [Methanobrevibacter boviskoreani]MDY5614961.1 coenzyme F420 hydrogenase subunit alpha [Methanobrevibacter bovis